MICVSIQKKNLSQILEILSSGAVEMAEIRLDLCPELSDADIISLFSSSTVALLATCRISEKLCADEAQKKLALAIKAGALFVDVEIEAPKNMASTLQKLAKQNGCRFIRSIHFFDGTPSVGRLEQVTKECFDSGAEIAKIVTTAHSVDDVSKVSSLYNSYPYGSVVAFCMGEKGRDSRFKALKNGAPFTYATLNFEEATAPGQWCYYDIAKALYGDSKFHCFTNVIVPASKSMAQRAIVAATLSDGESFLNGYSDCGDSLSALSLVSSLGFKVEKGSQLSICGKANWNNIASEVFVGESGFLTRFITPIIALKHTSDTIITGEKSLVGRYLKGAEEIMALFGVKLESIDDVCNLSVPFVIKGKLKHGNVTISGKDGSQIISGLIAALPLLKEDSKLLITEPKSIPYLLMTISVLRCFGIVIGYREISCNDGDNKSIELFIKGSQKYSPCTFDLEADWSGAAPFLVAGAIFSNASISCLMLSSSQADKLILDILKAAGAKVDASDGVVRVFKSPLHSFNADLNQAPDLFPIVAILAAFSEGESSIKGLGRLAQKESDRSKSIMLTLNKLGVKCRQNGDTLFIEGHSLSYRFANCLPLCGGSFSSFADHRIVMALKVAQMGASGYVKIDNEECVSKSFPQFCKYFE